jgi:hypothetical protein
MYKVKITNSNQSPASFVNKQSAFDWVGENCEENTTFSLLQYEGGSLSNMDRFTWDGFEMIEEDITT